MSATNVKTKKKKLNQSTRNKKKHAKKVLVLCGHEPTLDPRIHWAGDFSARADHDVVICGWTESNPEPKFEDPKIYRTRRLNKESDRMAWPALRRLILKAQIIPRYAFAFFAIFKIITFLSKIAWRILVAPFVILDYCAEKLRLERYSTRQIEFLFLLLRNWIYDLLNKASKRRLQNLIAGFSGYHWYFLEHSVLIAGAFIEYLKTENWVPDIIIANDPDTLLAAALAKHYYELEFIYDAHEYGPDAYLIHPEPRAIFFFYEHFLLRHADYYMTVTPQIADKFNSKYLKRFLEKKGRKFEVVPNASPIPSNKKKCEESPLPDKMKNKLKFLFLGGFAPNRGVEQIIREWKKVDPDKAVLLIQGPENEYKSKLIAEAQNTDQLENSIFFLESAAEDNLISSARFADVGIIPYASHIENHKGACPNKLSQYMHAGLAILSTDLAFVKDILNQSGGGLIYDDRADGDFAKKAMQFIDDPRLAKKYGRKNQKLAVESFSYDHYFPLIKKMIEENGKNTQKDQPRVRTH